MESTRVRQSQHIHASANDQPPLLKKSAAALMHASNHLPSLSGKHTKPRDGNTIERRPCAWPRHITPMRAQDTSLNGKDSHPWKRGPQALPQPSPSSSATRERTLNEQKSTKPLLQRSQWGFIWEGTSALPVSCVPRIPPPHRRENEKKTDRRCRCSECSARTRDHPSRILEEDRSRHPKSVLEERSAPVNGRRRGRDAPPRHTDEEDGAYDEREMPRDDAEDAAEEDAGRYSSDESQIKSPTVIQARRASC